MGNHLVFVVYSVDYMLKDPFQHIIYWIIFNVQTNKFYVFLQIFTHLEFEAATGSNKAGRGSKKDWEKWVTLKKHLFDPFCRWTGYSFSYGLTTWPKWLWCHQRLWSLSSSFSSHSKAKAAKSKSVGQLLSMWWVGVHSTTIYFRVLNDSVLCDKRVSSWKMCLVFWNKVCFRTKTWV